MQQTYANLEARKSAEIERVLPQLEVPRSDPRQIGAVNQYVSYIRAVESVPSTLLSPDLLLSPVVLLLAQALILLWQVMVRGRPAPLMQRLLN